MIYNATEPEFTFPLTPPFFILKSHPELNFILWREPVRFPGAVSQLPSQQQPMPSNRVLNDFPGVWNAINMIRASGHAIATAACRHTQRSQQHSFSPSGQKMTGMSPWPQSEAKFSLTWANTPKPRGLWDPATGPALALLPSTHGVKHRDRIPGAPARLKMGMGVWTMHVKDFRGGGGSVLKGLTAWMQMCLSLPPL